MTVNVEWRVCPVSLRHIGRELPLPGDSLQIFLCRGRRGRISGTRELVTVFPYVIVYEVGDTGSLTIFRV